MLIQPLVKLKKKLGWTEYRIKDVLELMLQEGMMWTDEQFDSSPPETVYWIPSLWNNGGSGLSAFP